jgi:hypothetical protein
MLPWKFDSTRNIIFLILLFKIRKGEGCVEFLLFLFVLFISVKQFFLLVLANTMILQDKIILEFL